MSLNNSSADFKRSQWYHILPLCSQERATSYKTCLPWRPPNVLQLQCLKKNMTKTWPEAVPLFEKMSLNHNEYLTLDQICMLSIFASNSSHLILWENVYTHIYTHFSLKSHPMKFLKIIFTKDGLLMRFESQGEKNLLISYQAKLNNSVTRDSDDLGGKFNNDINQM